MYQKNNIEPRIRSRPKHGRVVPSNLKLTFRRAEGPVIVIENRVMTAPLAWTRGLRFAYEHGLSYFLFMGTALRCVQLTYIRRGPRTVRTVRES